MSDKPVVEAPAVPEKDTLPVNPVNVDESPAVDPAELDELLDIDSDIKEDSNVKPQPEPDPTPDAPEPVKAEEDPAPVAEKVEPRDAPKEEAVKPGSTEPELLDPTESLRAQINQLAGILQSHGINPAEVLGAQGQQAVPVQPQAQPQQAPVQGQPKPQQNVPVSYEVSEADFDRLFEDRSAFNQVLNNVLALSGQSSVHQITPLISQQVQMQVALQGAVHDFYRENADLARHRQFVGLVTQELIAKNPDWTLDKVFEQTASESRKRLGITSTPSVQTPAQAQPVPQERKPGLASSTTRKAPEPAPKLQGMEAEIADLMPEDY